MYLPIQGQYTLKIPLKTSRELRNHTIVGWWELLERDTTKAMIDSQYDGGGRNWLFSFV